MKQIFRELDHILRGEVTRPAALRRGEIEVSVGGLARVIGTLGALYGLCMGSFAVFRGGTGVNGYEQLLASMVKVPILFLLTLVITFPSLYVFNALVGSRLSLVSVLRLLVAALAVMVAVLASLGPIVAFFAVSTTSYPFMQLLNVGLFSAAGFLGCKFLLHTLHRLDAAQSAAGREEQRRVAPPSLDLGLGAAPPLVSAAEAEPAGAMERSDDGQPFGARVTTIFRLWVIVFGLVGAQMGWVLRPFIGYPGAPFTFLRDRESNIFEAVLRAAGHLFGA